MQKRQSIVLFLFASLFLVSGAAGLVYQIVWERLLELFFGVTMMSVTLTVGAFMAGLGLGSLYLVGGWHARSKTRCWSTACWSWAWPLSVWSASP